MDEFEQSTVRNEALNTTMFKTKVRLEREQHIETRRPRAKANNEIARIFLVVVLIFPGYVGTVKSSRKQNIDTIAKQVKIERNCTQH